MCGPKYIMYLEQLKKPKETNQTVVLNEILKLISELDCDEVSIFVIKI